MLHTLRNTSRAASSSTAAQMVSFATTVSIAFLASLLLLTAVTVVEAKDSKILVHIPFGMHRADGFDHIKADFGFASVTKPKSLAAYVYYIEETLCAAVDDQTKGFPSHETFHTPFILLINGGGICSAVTRVRHGQQIGASAVLFAMPHCMCNHMNCTAKYPQDDCRNTDPVLVNDGSAGDISIPSFVIMKPLGEGLKLQLRNASQPVLMELQWGLPDDAVSQHYVVPQVQYWSRPYDPQVSLEDYTDLKTVVSSLGDTVDVTPKFAVLNGTRYGCPQYHNQTDGPCDNLCTNQGRYCTVHAKDLSGHAIIKETLRRLCIWHHYPDSYYWDYAIDFKQECALKDPQRFADNQCIEASMKVGKIDVNKINACMSDSGGLDNDAPNTMLETAVSETFNSSVVTLPMIRVDHQALQWSSARSLFETICTTYWFSGVDRIPDVCNQCFSCADSVGCLQNGGKCSNFNDKERHADSGFPHHKSEKKKSGGGAFWKVFWTLFILAGVGGAGFYVYQNYYNGGGSSSFRRSGGNLMSDYMHLTSDD